MKTVLAAAVLGAVSLAGCAKGDQVNQCYPVSSWAAPTFKCIASAPPPPPPVVVEAPPPPPEEPPPPPEEKIELREKVNFNTGKSTLLPRSKTLLDEVAATLTEHPEIERVRIEGHTDDKDDNAFNQTLSEERAKAVRQYLISKGIAGDRLESVGFGEEKPVADNTTPEGREENRRVEIYITQRKK